MSEPIHAANSPSTQTPHICEESKSATLPPPSLCNNPDEPSTHKNEDQLVVSLGTGYTFGSDLYFDGKLSVDGQFGAGVPISHGFAVSMRFQSNPNDYTDIFIEGTRGKAKSTSSLKDVIPDIEDNEDLLVETILAKIDSRTTNELTTHGVKIGFKKPLLAPWQLSPGIKMFSLDAGLAFGVLHSKTNITYQKRDKDAEDITLEDDVLWKKTGAKSETRIVAPLVTAIFFGELIRGTIGPMSFLLNGEVHLGGGLVLGGTDLGGLVNFGWKIGGQIGVTF